MRQQIHGILQIPQNRVRLLHDALQPFRKAAQHVRCLSRPVAGSDVPYIVQARLQVLNDVRVHVADADVLGTDGREVGGRGQGVVVGGGGSFGGGRVLFCVGAFRIVYDLVGRVGQMGRQAVARFCSGGIFTVRPKTRTVVKS